MRKEEKNKEPRLQGGALRPKFINQKTRSRNKFGMTKRSEPNRHVMLNLFQHLVCLFSAFSRRIFHPRPQEGVFRCEFNKILSHIEKVDSGGQTGVERAALDLELGFPSHAKLDFPSAGCG
jgi:hypothetical protein